jgi:hypothetical protein
MSKVAGCVLVQAFLSQTEQCLASAALQVVLSYSRAQRAMGFVFKAMLHYLQVCHIWLSEFVS